MERIHSRIDRDAGEGCRVSADYEVHEAANIFPNESETIQALADDIEANGQLVPIELYHGKIIDGRRRYQACMLKGIEPRFKDVCPDDPVSYVLSLNLHRRQLTASQISIVGAKARDIYEREAKERQLRKSPDSVVVKLPPQNKGKARDKAGEAVGVSGSYIDRATKVLEKGVPELVKAVESGEVNVTKAAKIAELPPEEQIAELETPKEEPKPKPEPEDEPDVAEQKQKNAKGILYAIDAINALKKIPRTDPQRERGYQMVAEFIKTNKRVKS